jgi:guanylate kinase
MIHEASPIVISGPSGCGKDTIVTKLREMDEHISLAVSATTRAPRGEEVDGLDYYFLSREEFETRIENDEFIEYVQYNDNYYGTLRSELTRLANEGKKCVLVIEVKGAANIIARYPDCLSIFVMPPSMDELDRRLHKRASETEDEIRKRLRIALDEIKRAGQYKHVVVNDDLDATIEEIHKLIIGG